MNKLGLMFLNNNEKSSKTKNSSSNLFGKTMINNSMKSLKFSKVMEENELKTDLNETKPELLKGKTVSVKTDIKSKLNTNIPVEKSETKKEENVIAANTLLKTEKGLAKVEIENEKEVKYESKKSMKESNEKVNSNVKDIKKEESKREKKDDLQNVYNQNLNNVVLISETNQVVKKEQSDIQLDKEEDKINGLKLFTEDNKNTKKELVMNSFIDENGIKLSRTKDNTFKFISESDEKPNLVDVNEQKKGVEVKETTEFKEVKGLKTEVLGKESFKGVELKTEELELKTEVKTDELNKKELTKKEEITDKWNIKVEKNSEENRNISIVTTEPKLYAKSVETILNDVNNLEKVTNRAEILSKKINNQENIANELKQSVKTENTPALIEEGMKNTVVTVKNGESSADIIVKQENGIKKEFNKVLKSEDNSKKIEIAEVLVAEKENIELKETLIAVDEEIKPKELNIPKESTEKSEVKISSNEKDISNKNTVLAEKTGTQFEQKIELRTVETTPVVSSKKDVENSFAQVENMIKMNFNADTQEMRLRLSPEDLGEVEVKISIEKNIMKAEFMVENERVKEMLESRFTDLKSALLEKGISSGEINVNISGGNSQERGYAQKAFYEELNEGIKFKKENSIDKNYVAAVEKKLSGYNRNLNGSLDIVY